MSSARRTDRVAGLWPSATISSVTRASRGAKTASSQSGVTPASGRMADCDVSRAGAAANIPSADSTPGVGGTNTRGMPSASASSQAWSGPPPPKASSVKRRGSWPRSTDTRRMARSMAALATRTTASAAASTVTPISAASAPTAARADASCSAICPPRKRPALSRDRTRLASVTVATADDRPPTAARVTAAGECSVSGCGRPSAVGGRPSAVIPRQAS